MRENLAPGSSFTLITQNVDGLSSRAVKLVAERFPDLTNEALSETAQNNLLEMHGRLFDVICTQERCNHREFNLTSPISPALAGTEENLTKDAPERDIPVTELPVCTKCGSLVRPGVVWFEEIPWYLNQIDELVAKADLCIVVGTSSTASAS